MRFWRRMLRMSRIEHRTNESTLGENNERSEIFKTIKTLRWNIICAAYYEARKRTSL